MFLVVHSGGPATVQDLGWRGHRSIGLPPGGALDPAALRIGNALVGNDPGAAGIELTPGSHSFRPTRPVTLAVTGGNGPVTVDGAEAPGWRPVPVTAGSLVTIGPSEHERFRYLAIDGGVAVDPTLGSRSTYLPSGLGGWEGRRLLSGDSLPLGPASERRDRPDPGKIGPEEGGPIRVTAGPQGAFFPPSAFADLAGEPFRIVPASDRMGTRLTGPKLTPRSAATLPSESTALGAIQVPDSGDPIVILADGPTVGGYLKIGAVIGADLARFAQLPLGAMVRFRWVSITEAIRVGREREERLDALLRRLRASDRG